MMAARPSAAASAAPRAPSVSGGAARAAAPRRSAAVCAGSGNNRKLRDLEKRLERGRQRLEQIEMAREVEEGGGELPPRPAEDAAERLELAAEAMELPAWEGPDEGFEDWFGFRSWGPEVVNGRLAMLGFVAGAAAEMNSGQTALSQFTDSHLAFIIATAHIMLASYIPIINGEKSAAPETMEEGMWKASSELQNGRAAMVGLTCMFVQEAITGTPVF